MNKFNTKIVSCKTIRLKSSLAYSSRNTLLSKKEIFKASLASKMTNNFYKLAKKNFGNIKKINKLKKKIEFQKIKVEYLEVRNKKNLSTKVDKSNFKIFLSFYLNKVRLIDNF